MKDRRKRPDIPTRIKRKTIRLAFKTFVQMGKRIIVLDDERAAEYHDRVYQAFAEAKTWQEFRKIMPRDEYSRLVREMDDRADEDELARVKRRGPFNSSVIPGYDEGDYPHWSMQSPDQVIPADLLERYGTQEANMVNGTWWVIYEKNWPELKRALEERGFTLVDRSDLAYFR